MTESEVVKRLHALPAVGARVKVTYNCEYMGMESAARDGGRKSSNRDKKWTRYAIVTQKTYNGARSSVTMEIQPDTKCGKRGRYKISFMAVDVINGDVKIEEA